MDYDFLNKKSDKDNKDDAKIDEIVVEENAVTEKQDLKFEDNTFNFDPIDTLNSPLYSNQSVDTKLELRSTKKLGSDEYHQRLLELNLNAENKHYVLFFGKPASGKTFIIGSLLHYMKNILGRTVYLDDEKTTKFERKLFSQLQDRFSGERFSKKIGRTSTDEYYEFHIHFTPKDSNKLPLDIVFVDASGEHSERVAIDLDNNETGELPDYLRVILESDVNTKLAFVYDKFLPAQENKATQVSMLDQIFTKVQLLQQRQKKFYPKILLLAKSDKIESEDSKTVEKYEYSATKYARGIIPSFANGFFNENPDNKAIFYKMGIFSITDDILLKFEEDCPARLFKWLYRESVNITLENPPSCWEKLVSWFRGK